MGLFDLLSREARAKSALEKQIKRANKKLALSADRFAAMEKLREIGTDEALHGLVQRFSFTYHKNIEDEQEKEWVCDTLIGLGEKAIEPVRRYARSSEGLSYPLRILEAVAPPERMLAIVDELLERDEPGYTRDPARKIQLLTWLGEWKGAVPAAEVSRRIVPYLEDFDETVRFNAVEAIEAQPDPDTARAPLVAALVRPEEESRRLKVRVADALATLGWTVTDRKEEVSRLLAAELPEFGMQHDRLVRKKER